MIIEIRTFNLRRISNEKGGFKIEDKNKLIPCSAIFSIMEATEQDKIKYLNERVKSIITLKLPDGKILNIPAYNSYEYLHSRWKEEI